MAGEAVIGALRADLILNTAQLETGVGRSRTVLDSLNQSLMKTAGAAEGSGAAFKRLLEKFDPLEAATGRFTRAKKELDRALKAGLGDDLYAAHMQRLEEEYESAKAALDPLNIALKKNADIVSQLEAKFDPLSVATKKFNSDLAQLNDAKIILNLDADKYEAALARLTLQFEKTKASLQSLGGADTRALRNAIDGIAGASSGGFYSAADSASVFSAEIDRLRTELDPAFASSKKFTSALDDLDRAHQLGAISAGKHKAAVERLAAEFQGPISSGVRKSAADMDAFASEIDQLEAKFDPLSAATRRYNNDLDELKRAQITLGLSAEQVAAQQKRLAANFEFNRQAINGFGASAQQAGFHSTNLFFQFQDISTMLASGQSPFVLAMQQGPQIVGIFEQIKSSGGGLKSVIGDALGALVSPLSLITIGSIAAGAAMLYWLTGSGEKAKTLEESLGNLSGAVGELKSITDLLSDSDLSGLTEQYGALNNEVLELLNLQRELAVMDAVKASQDAMAASMSAMSGWIVSDLESVASAFGLMNDEGAAAYGILQQIEAVKLAESPEAALAATVALRENIERTVGPIAGLKGEAYAMARGLVESEANLRQAVVQSQRAEAALAGAKTQAQALSSAAPGAGWMNDAIGETNLLIGKLIQARALAKVDAVGTQGLAAQYAQYGAGRAAFEGGAKEAFNPLYGSAAISALRVSDRGGGGGGGAAKAMSDTADSVKKLNDAFADGETPIAKFRAELAKLDEMKLSGLSDGAYAEGVSRLNQELGKSSLIGKMLSGGGLSGAWNDFKVQGRDAWSGILTQAFAKDGKGFKAISEGLSGAFKSVGSLFTGGGMAALSGAMPIIGAVMAGIDLVKGLMGSTTETNSGLRGQITLGGMDLTQYTDKHWSGFFGLANNYWTELSEASTSISGPLLSASTKLQAEVMKMAGRLGFGADTFKNFSYNIDVSLKGLTESEALEKLRGAMSGMGDAFASMLSGIGSMQELSSVFNERLGIDRQILQLRGDEAGLRAIEIDQTHELNRAKLQELHAMQDAKKATDAMAAALSKLSADQFATALDFARARGRAAAGLRVVGGIDASPQQIIASQQGASQEAALVSNLNATMAQVLNFLRSRDEDRALRVKVVG